MTIEEYMRVDPDEKPLDNIPMDGGMCAIFRTIGCIGDSLSSGEFESLSAEGKKGYHDFFEYSWGQYIARHAGLTAYNFSKGGMTAKQYWNSFAEEKGYWSPDLLCQAYIIALGVNDILNQKQDVGSIHDICLEDYNKNADTFAGYYGRIIQRIKSMQPHARFFLVTMPRDGSPRDERKPAHAALLHEMADLFDYTYVIDLNRYAPVYDAEFKRRYYLGGHMNPAGYILTARMMESYIDYIVRHNPEDFLQIPFIGKGYHNTSAKW
jgi:lysophospholipase L1-like esterase